MPDRRAIPMLNVGDKMPNFTLPLAFADGKKDPVEFGSLLGKGPIVVAFFPLAFTAPCTQENCDLRDHQAQLDKLHVQRVSFSCDTPHTNVEFARKNSLQHGIFSDPNHKVVNEIWDTAVIGGVASRAKRGWMVLDRNGVVVDKYVAPDPSVWAGFKAIEEALQKVKA